MAPPTPAPSPWSAGMSAFESFLNNKSMGEVAEVAEIAEEVAVLPSPATVRRAPAVSKQRQQLASPMVASPKVASPMVASPMVASPMVSSPMMASSFVASPKVDQGRARMETPEVTGSSEATELATFFSPVKAAAPVPAASAQVTLSETSEGATKVRARKLKTQRPKQDNLALVRSETIFVPAEAPVLEEASSHPCSLCDNTFASSVQLIEHKASHTSQKVFACDQCGKNWKREAGLANHTCTGHSARKRRRRKNVEELLVGGTGEEGGLGEVAGPLEEQEPDIGPIVESVEVEVEVTPLHYTIEFLGLQGLAVEVGNLPWLEEDLPGEEEVLETRDLVEVIREVEGLTVSWDEEVQVQEKLPEWEEEVAKLCGIGLEEVREVMEVVVEVKTTKPEPFPWQLVPSEWQKEVVLRREREEQRKVEEAAKAKERKEEETAAMWRRQAALLHSSKAQEENKEETEEKEAPTATKKSDKSLSTFAYFNTAAVEVGDSLILLISVSGLPPCAQVNSGEESEEEEWLPEARPRCGVCRRAFPSRCPAPPAGGPSSP